MAVERDSTHGAEIRPVGAAVGCECAAVPRAFFFERALEQPASKVGAEVRVRNELDAAPLARERLGPFSDHHHVRRFLHDETREKNRILDALEARDCSGRHRAPVHDGRIELVGPLVSVDRPLASVELRRVFEDDDRCLHSIEARPALRERAMSGPERSFHRRSHLRCAGAERLEGEIAGSSVDHQSPEKGSEVDPIFHGTMATARSGAPLPPPIFIGSATRDAPRSGRRSRAVRFSKAGTLRSKRILWVSNSDD